MKLSNHAGPIGRNLTSLKKDGFLPSIVWPTNWPIHASTKTTAQTFQTAQGDEHVDDHQRDIAQ